MNKENIFSALVFVAVLLALALAIDQHMTVKEQAECATWANTIKAEPWANWQIEQCNHYGVTIVK